jgi:hypothetical protein
MAKVLEMQFATELGRSQTIRVYEAKEDLTDAEVIAAMDNIITKNIFSGTGGALTGKLSAQIVTTTTQDISLA